MSAGFQAVQWNRRKIIYDVILLAGIVLYLGAYLALASWLSPPKDYPAAIDIRIGAFGTCAFLMLTIILAIGPLTRLNPRFLPLLYNRRHFGVLTFLVALVHACLMVQWFAVQGGLPDLLKEMLSTAGYGKFIGFPFKMLGLAALLVLFLMAATSHDFWLAFLTPPVWKGLHMALYLAYGLVVMHVALGLMQDDRNPLIPAMLIAGFGSVTALHLVAGWRERNADRGVDARSDGWLPVGPPESITDKRARIVLTRGGERIAVFRDGNQIGALSNLCAHQNGPIGEGAIIDGCVTCPWHGYQYRLADGCAPAPFTEKLATYRVRIAYGVVEVDPRPLPPGTVAAIMWRSLHVIAGRGRSTRARSPCAAGVVIDSGSNASRVPE
jgi:nitrite reductase/ring-hydroxylating ferredoxin subunit/DMSO/TMAO reductase YedYZ heme-binding membrane subunit